MAWLIFAPPAVGLIALIVVTVYTKRQRAREIAMFERWFEGDDS